MHTVEYLHYYGIYLLYTKLAFEQLYIVYKNYYLHYYGRYEFCTIFNFEHYTAAIVDHSIYFMCIFMHFVLNNILYILLILIENGKGFTSSVDTKLYCTVYYIKLHIFICFKRSRPYLALNIKSPGYILWQNRSSYLPAAKLSCQALCVFWQDNFNYFREGT